VHQPLRLFVTTSTLLALSTLAAAHPTGQFTAHQDIGAVKRAGRCSSATRTVPTWTSTACR